jgi:peroxiredoxin (alkyl hydroperoxide reductase subunit C)
MCDDNGMLPIAMRHSDEHGIVTPANRRIGDNVIVPPPGSCGSPEDRVEKPAPDTKVLDWFLCLKKYPHGGK